MSARAERAADLLAKTCLQLQKELDEARSVAKVLAHTVHDVLPMLNAEERTALEKALAYPEVK